MADSTRIRSRSQLYLWSVLTSFAIELLFWLAIGNVINHSKRTIIPRELRQLVFIVPEAWHSPSREQEDQNLNRIAKSGKITYAWVSNRSLNNITWAYRPGENCCSFRKATHTQSLKRSSILQCEICYMGTGLRIRKHANIIFTSRGVVLAIFYVFYPIFLRSSRETFVSPHYYFAWTITIYLRNTFS